MIKQKRRKKGKMRRKKWKKKMAKKLEKEQEKESKKRWKKMKDVSEVSEGNLLRKSMNKTTFGKSWKCRMFDG